MRTTSRRVGAPSEDTFFLDSAPWYCPEASHVADLPVVLNRDGLTKESAVPDAEIERAIRRKRAFEASPADHTYEETDGQEDT